MKPKPKLKSTQANKLIKEAREKILGPGLKERIKRDAERPYKYPGNTGILWLPEWQDGVLFTSEDIAALIEKAAAKKRDGRA
jgi:hypothetical protein